MDFEFLSLVPSVAEFASTMSMYAGAVVAGASAMATGITVMDATEEPLPEWELVEEEEDAVVLDVEDTPLVMVRAPMVVEEKSRDDMSLEELLDACQKEREESEVLLEQIQAPNPVLVALMETIYLDGFIIEMQEEIVVVEQSQIRDPLDAPVKTQGEINGPVQHGNNVPDPVRV